MSQGRKPPRAPETHPESRIDPSALQGESVDYEELLRQLVPGCANFQEALNTLIQHNNGNFSAFLTNIFTELQAKNIKYFSKEKPNFWEYLTARGQILTPPNNCLHAYIAYDIYRQQEGVRPDPTETGRNIKRAHMYVR